MFFLPYFYFISNEICYFLVTKGIYYLFFRDEIYYFFVTDEISTFFFLILLLNSLKTSVTFINMMKIKTKPDIKLKN